MAVALTGAVSLCSFSGRVFCRTVFALARFPPERVRSRGLNTLGGTESGRANRPAVIHSAALSAKKDARHSCVPMALTGGRRVSDSLFLMGREMFRVMLRTVLGMCEQLKVFQPVIRLVAVDVVDMAARRNLAVCLFPYFPVKANEGAVVPVPFDMPNLTAPVDAGITHSDIPS